MKSDQRGKVVELLQRKIPRSKSGDPSFASLGIEALNISSFLPPDPQKRAECLLEVFTPEEIVTMCNRFLYQAEYQRGWHRKWEREKAEALAPLKRKVVEMFPELRSWSKASDEQLKAAQSELNKEKEKKS